MSVGMADILICFQLGTSNLEKTKTAQQVRIKYVCLFWGFIVSLICCICNVLTKLSIIFIDKSADNGLV